MSEIKQVKITDKTDKCYRMVGNVTGINRLGQYYVNIKGYDNCIKAGYSPERIKQANLDKIGFSRTVDADKCEVVDTEQTAKVAMDDDLSAMSKQELMELAQSLRGELTAAQEYIEYLNIGRRYKKGKVSGISPDTLDFEKSTGIGKGL